MPKTETRCLFLICVCCFIVDGIWLGDTVIYKKYVFGGVWMAQSVECLTLDFSSGPDLMVPEIELWVWPWADRVEPAWGSLSPPLSLLPLPCSCSFSLPLALFQNK